MAWLSGILRSGVCGVLYVLWCLGSNTMGKEAGNPAVRLAGVIQINWQNTWQKIEGFGASSAWTGGAIPKPVLERFYCRRNKRYLGLTLLRVRLEPDGWVRGYNPTEYTPASEKEFQAAKKVQGWGGQIWASVWSPPNKYKNGNKLKADQYDAYATHLVRAVSRMKTAGLNIRYLSPQNEPDFTGATWERCLYTADEYANLIHILGEKLRTSKTRLIGPETGGIGGFTDSYEKNGWGNKLKRSTRNNKSAGSYLAKWAVHAYDYKADFEGNQPRWLHRRIVTWDSKKPILWDKKNKSTWITEDSLREYDLILGHSPIDIALVLGIKIHRALFEGRVNAWHHWSILRSDNKHSTPYEGLLDDFNANKITKRGFAIAQYARFIRPGARQLRININGHGINKEGSNLLLSAYRTHSLSKVLKCQKQCQIVLVGINKSNGLIKQDVKLNGLSWVGGGASFITNSRRDMQFFQRKKNSSRKRQFTLQFPAKSIVTWVFHVNGPGWGCGRRVNKCKNLGRFYCN
jgi:glucuronoarabinoxylan endo-1,4-beta-xylanase